MFGVVAIAIGYNVPVRGTNYGLIFINYNTTISDSTVGHQDEDAEHRLQAVPNFGVCRCRTSVCGAELRLVGAELRCRGPVPVPAG